MPAPTESARQQLPQLLLPLLAPPQQQHEPQLVPQIPAAAVPRPYLLLLPDLPPLPPVKYLPRLLLLLLLLRRPAARRGTVGIARVLVLVSARFRE